MHLQLPFFVGNPLALPLHNHGDMLRRFKERFNMSPLMLMVLLSVVPFPILAIVFLADRLVKAGPKAAS